MVFKQILVHTKSYVGADVGIQGGGVWSVRDADIGFWTVVSDPVIVGLCRWPLNCGSCQTRHCALSLKVWLWFMCVGCSCSESGVRLAMWWRYRVAVVLVCGRLEHSSGLSG